MGKACAERAALRALIRAESFWMLNLTKQTFESRAEDCKNLGRVLDLIGEASRRSSLGIDIGGYRKAVAEMEGFFSVGSGSVKAWPLLYSAFCRQQKKFRHEAASVH